MIKIAIQGHPTRGKEVIQMLENLGGINLLNLFGSTTYRYYYICDDNIIRNTFYDTYYKIYTLEAFEKEFPFKIGDKVIYDYTTNFIGRVVDIKFDDNIPYRVNINGTICTCGTMSLKPYKEMEEEERNITLTLNKAKEWYNKGGELKEVALQAYSEEELTKVELPKSWEEFCENYPVKAGECWIGAQSFINICKTDLNKRECKNWIPSKKSAESNIALIQLEQLRDCYRQGDIPDLNDNNKKYYITKVKDSIIIDYTYDENYFLLFTKEEVAEKFLNNFEPLIKIAEDYL